MPDRLLAPTAVAALLCLTPTARAAETPGTMNAEQGWSSITRCAQEDSERGRHTCLDRVLREAGLLTEEMHARQQRRAFGLEDKPVRAPTLSPQPAAAAAASAGAAPSASVPPSSSAAASATPPTGVGAASAARAKTVAPSPARPPEPDRLEVELMAVTKAANGRLFVTTRDGAVWLQTEAVDMPQPPVVGDHMTIRKGSMGGYRCSVVSTHLTYRCVRNR